MATYKHTGVGSGTARTHYGSIAQLQDGDILEIGSVSGVDTITGSLSPAITAYATGQAFIFVSAGANTGAVTVNINSVGAKDITKRGTTALAANDILSGQVCKIVYDGTRFQLLNPSDAVNRTDSTTLSGDITFAGDIIIPNDGELTIATGVITVTGAAHTVDTEANASTDDLVTINGGTTGAIVEFALADATRDVVFKHGSGNIQNANNVDITMGAANDRMYYKYDGTNWVFLFKNFDLVTSPFSKSFTSSDQTITAAGSLTLAHSMATIPTLVQIYLVCQTGELGYTAGDLVAYGFADFASGAGLSVVPDATNLNIRYGSDANVFYIAHKTTGASSGITLVNWRMRVRAWA